MDCLLSSPPVARALICFRVLAVQYSKYSTQKDGHAREYGRASATSWVCYLFPGVACVSLADMISARTGPEFKLRVKVQRVVP